MKFVNKETCGSIRHTQELADICGQIKQNGILDGEIIAVKDGVFYAIQKDP